MSGTIHKLATHELATVEAQLSDGSTARIEDGVLELHNPQGRLLLRYVDGRAEISAPDGDLILAAPRGRVEVHSAEDVHIQANRDVVCHGRRDVRVQGGGQAELKIEPENISLNTAGLQVKATKSQLTTESSELFSRHVVTIAQRVVTRAEHVETEAQQLVEKAREAFSDVQGLLQQRVGRMRTLVDDVLTIRSRRTVMNSTEDTSIDGERILLG